MTAEDRTPLPGWKGRVIPGSNAANWYLADELNADLHFVGVRPCRWTSEASGVLPCGLGGRNRTCALLLPKQAGWPLPYAQKRVRRVGRTPALRFRKADAASGGRDKTARTLGGWTTKISYVSIRACPCSSRWRYRRGRSKSHNLNEGLARMVGYAPPIRQCAALRRNVCCAINLLLNSHFPHISPSAIAELPYRIRF